ncbi:LuxR C-terminal-related transcriptional regulator [Alkalimarinus coralli]|uniref:LuxR C-terminal-related transcriptional regulator n=1 Tax=Alkalimarinus coralli TaxID=2935863 RepID=UPI00202B892D|nr:LuxR C-terminal-related transcriptional regulator [Alkalimarinus coralli]
MRYEIQRNELLCLLDKGLNYPLTLIVAAPGFGKTTLLGQWQVHSAGNTVIKLDASTRDDSPLSIFKKIFNELKKSTPLWDAPFFNFFKTEQLVSTDAMVDILVQAFNLVDNRLVIIIDDFHNLKDAFVSTVFCQLIAHLPGHVSLVLSSRMHPEFSVSRLKLAERILVIDGNDLKLTKQDITYLSLEITGKELEESKILTLYTQTEGWIVGVKLALLAYVRSGESALNSFSGNQPELLNYFGFEVLKHLTEDARKFVLSSALFEHFDVELCRQVFGPESAIILERLAAQELFIVPVNDVHGAFRYHSLLQEFLQSRLLVEEGASYVNYIHRCAAEYFLTKHLLSQAIRHASLCGDEDYYNSVLATSCNEWIKSGEFESVFSSLSGISDEITRKKSSLSIPLIYACIFSRRFNQARYYLEILQHGDVADQASVKFLESVLALFQRDAEVFDDARAKYFTRTHENTDMRAVSMVIIAYIFLYKGQLEPALIAANDAKEYLSKAGYTFLESYADLVVILCDRYMGRGVEAAQYMTELYSHLDEQHKTPVWVNLATGMMVVYYEQNQLESAVDLCQKLLPVVSFSCATEVVSTVYLSYSRLLHIQGEKQKAFKLLDQLDRILVFGRYDRFQSQIVQELMRQAVVEQSVSSADGIAQKYDLSLWIEQEAWRDEAYYQESRERYGLASVYWLTAKGRYDRASDILTKLIATLDKQGIKTRALIAHCNLLVVNYHQGNRDIVINQLKKLLERYGLACFSRTVFDESPGLDSVFKHALSRNRIELPVVFRELFEDQLKETETTHQPSLNPNIVLTEKELEIFELLAAGLSNTDISKQTGIALSTTKWHLKNIYAKLGVSNRSGAMMLAHQR